MIEIYYAEDDEMIGESVKQYLEGQNCRVAVFETAAGIRRALIAHLPTVVLLDWNMPDGQGNELCRWIRERWEGLPVIYLTVRGDSQDIVEGFRNGADDYVVKPFDLAVLHSRILALLRRTESAAGAKKRPRAARSGKVLVSCSFPSEAAQQPLMFPYYSSKEIPCPNAPWTIQVLAANSEPACIASSMVPPLRSSSKNAVAKESPAPRVSPASTSVGTYG